MRTIPPAALRLRSMAPAHAALANALGGGRRAAFDIEGAAVEIELAAAQDVPAPQAVAELVLDTEFGPMSLRPGAQFLRLLCGIDLPPQQGGDDDAQWLLAQAALVHAPAGWRRLFRLRSLQIGVGPAGDASALIRLCPSGEGWSLVGELRAQASVLRGLADSPGWTAGDAVRLDESGLGLRRPVEIGRGRLNLRELRTLSPGDVLLVEQGRFGCDGAGVVVLGRLRMHGLLDEAGFRFERWSISMDEHDELPEEEEEARLAEPEAAPEPRPAADAESAPPLDELPLSLVFEVGALEMSIAALRRLAPGSVIELQRPLPPEVIVRCGGLVVARGELVELEGRLGVQIAQMERAP
jgi:type III secretion protein Q